MKNDVKSANCFLSVRDIRIEYQSEGKRVYAVNGISFDLEEGKTLGLIGETGAGKTSIAKAIMRILPDYSTKKQAGEVYLDGIDTMKLPEREMRKLRGYKLAMIFQDPMTALNPVQTIGDQISETVRLHSSMNKKEALDHAKKMLELVGISSDRAGEYPHQFSGGMKQRVVIGMALACSPKLLIADEPTTALDVTIQAQVIDMINDLKSRQKTAMIMITHDFGIIAETCDYVAVVYGGRILEYGSKEEIFDHPLHPYTVGLFNALPNMNKGARRLKPIDGLPPNPTIVPDGCPFAPRCPYVQENCLHGEMPVQSAGGTHICYCVGSGKEGSGQA